MLLSLSPTIFLSHLLSKCPSALFPFSLLPFRSCLISAFDLCHYLSVLCHLSFHCPFTSSPSLFSIITSMLCVLCNQQSSNSTQMQLDRHIPKHTHYNTKLSTRSHTSKAWAKPGMGRFIPGICMEFARGKKKTEFSANYRQILSCYRKPTYRIEQNTHSNNHYCLIFF